MAVQVYINFNGNCRDAFDFYSQIFGADELQVMFYGDIPSSMGFPASEETKKFSAGQVWGWLVI